MNESGFSPERFQERMIKLLQLLPRLSRHFSDLYGRDISESYIQNAIFERLEDEEDMVAPFDLLKIDITYEEGVKLLHEFDFSQLDIELELHETDLPFGIFPDTYASIKSSGKIWRIHLNDVDPWPSNPHAHLIATNIKLNLSTGDTYAGRQLKKRIPRKTLVDIRTKFEQHPAFRGTMPPLTV